MKLEDIDVRGKVVFLSSPMTGMDDGHLGKTARMHAKLKDMGAASVWSPLNAMLFDGAGRSHEYYMRESLRKLIGYDDQPDIAVFMPGWRDSHGCLVEAVMANAVGVPSVFLVDAGKGSEDAESPLDAFLNALDRMQTNEG